MILLGIAGDERVGFNRVDDRLVGWQDVMPTLLDLAGCGYSRYGGGHVDGWRAKAGLVLRRGRRRCPRNADDLPMAATS